MKRYTPHFMSGFGILSLLFSITFMTLSGCSTRGIQVKADNDYLIESIVSLNPRDISLIKREATNYCKQAQKKMVILKEERTPMTSLTNVANSTIQSKDQTQHYQLRFSCQ